MFSREKSASSQKASWKQRLLGRHGWPKNCLFKWAVSDAQTIQPHGYYSEVLYQVKKPSSLACTTAILKVQMSNFNYIPFANPGCFRPAPQSHASIICELWERQKSTTEDPSPLFSHLLPYIFSSFSPPLISLTHSSSWHIWPKDAGSSPVEFSFCSLGIAISPGV